MARDGKKDDLGWNGAGDGIRDVTVQEMGWGMMLG